MSTLSVRLPKELDRSLPKRARSAWVIEAIREKLVRDRMRAIGESAAAHEAEDLAIVEEWEPATAPFEPEPKKKGRR